LAEISQTVPPEKSIEGLKRKKIMEMAEVRSNDREMKKKRGRRRMMFIVIG
jgi:hypothetical protein